MDSNRRYPKDDYKLFIGDGILAVFPIEHMATTRSVARDAVAAAHTALAGVRVLGRHLIV
jgi:class 3 adenylate cyclase